MHSFVDVVLFIGTKYNVIILILIYMYTVCACEASDKETQIILPAYQFILVLKKYILRTLRFAMAGL